MAAITCRHTPPGSSVTFVELSDNKGWIVESAKEHEVLEKSVDGTFMVENITGMHSIRYPRIYHVVVEKTKGTAVVYPHFLCEN